MSLSKDQKREIAQLMFVARHYLRLATSAKGEAVKMGNTKGDFASGATLGKRARRLTIIGAHLSSAAIRLASIEDVFEDAGIPNPSYVDCRAYFRGDPRLADTDPRAVTCSDWLHIMLRDNAAHEEPDPARTGRKGIRWKTRQSNLEHTTFADAFDKIRAIATDLRTLSLKHGVAC
jgi:hypothetical protein